MSLTEHQIRLFAIYFTDDQLIQLFNVTNKDINEAFLDMDRPKPDLHLLISLLNCPADAIVGHEQLGTSGTRVISFQLEDMEELFDRDEPPRFGR